MTYVLVKVRVIIVGDLLLLPLDVRKHQCLRFFFISSVERELTRIVHLVWSNGDALILRSPIVFCDFWDYSINCASLVCDPCHSLIGMFYFLRCMYGYDYARDCLSTAQRHVNSLIFLESY